MANLFQLSNQYLQIEQTLIDNGGEITPELEQLLEENKDALQVKFTSLGFVTRSLSSQEQAIDNEIERLTKLKKTIKNSKDRLFNYIQSNMERLGMTEVKGELMTLKIRQNPVSVAVLDAEQIPKKYFTKKVTEQLDKTAVKQALEAGKKIKGAELKRTTSLVIK